MSFKTVDGYNTVKESTIEEGVYLFDLGTEEGRNEADRYYAEKKHRAHLRKEM